MRHRKPKFKNYAFIIITMIVFAVVATFIKGEFDTYVILKSMVISFPLSVLIDTLLSNYHTIALLKLMWMVHNPDKIIERFFGAQLGRLFRKNPALIADKFKITKQVFATAKGKTPQLARDIWARAYKVARAKYPYKPTDYSKAKKAYDEYLKLENKVPAFDELLERLMNVPEEPVYVVKFRPEEEAAYKGEKDGEYRFCGWRFNLKHDSKKVQKQVYKLVPAESSNGMYDGSIEMIELHNKVYDYYEEEYSDMIRGCFRLATEEEIRTYQKAEARLKDLYNEKLILDTEYQERKKRLMDEMDELSKAFKKESKKTKA